LHPDQVIVTDMGTALLSGHQVLRPRKNQRLMTSTGLGEMGYGLPAAIGASFARDRGEVMCLNCDGGMMMNLQELQTIAHHRLPIKLFIFNNDGYLMIKHTQNALFAGHKVGVDAVTGVTCPDFSALAEAFGMPAYQIHTWDDFDRVLPLVQAESGPTICEVFMDPEQLFVPKLSVAISPDGTLVSPPLEDLSPLLPREELRQSMLAGLHEKSESLRA
jgi:acetolactate synthase-1/2/3 large subunit